MITKLCVSGLVGSGRRTADRFAITDGFDVGVGALLPFVGKKDVTPRDAPTPWGRTGEGKPGLAGHCRWCLVRCTARGGNAATFFYIAMILTLMALFLRPGRFLVPFAAC